MPGCLTRETSQATRTPGAWLVDCVQYRIVDGVRLGIITLLFAAALVSGASAQTADHKFAIGGSFTVRAPMQRDAGGSKGVGLLWRFGPSRTGWGFKYGLSWFATDVEQTVAGLTTQLGELHIRPIMGGYGYTRVLGRTAVSANMLGGYAFTTFDLVPSASDAYRNRLGARSLDADVANTFVVKPDVSVWYDLSQKIGVNASAGFMIARPSLTVSTSLGDQVQRFRADTWIFKVGAVYKVF